MFFLLLISAIFTVNDAEERWITVNATEAYKELNSKYNVTWDESLASEALELAKNPVDVKDHKGEADKFVKGKEYFDKNDGSSMDVKVKKTLEQKIKDRHDEFKRFKSGARFGCNGVFNTTSPTYDFVSSVCLYKKHK
ncbi:unnamed protein product [Haemonchus placei]|uniref:SCP domain-containing protein n=1 Tax=Haemonchus placei TaxID=6290 RepID=A0A0N4X3A2_HAEPC|nr:unnamed protein product [Haemonchus placei]